MKKISGKALAWMFVVIVLVSLYSANVEAML